MCGIAGLVDLRGQREPRREVLEAMSATLVHRGPDDAGTHLAPGLGLASRRLSIVGLADGRQPICNEDRSVVVVFNGELFDHPQRRADLVARGHVFRTSCDTEILVHLWEDHGEAMLPMLRGQFAFALFDSRRRVLILARDRFGICPLHWSRQGDWLYFGSEIKALLASGEVPAAVDPRGLDHLFTFFAMPSRRTTFAGISAIPPGKYLRLEWPGGAVAEPREHEYWDLDFPDQGAELDPRDERPLVEEFRAAFDRAVEQRLRADVPVVGYLSGGIDSAAVCAAAARVRGSPVPTFTVRIATPRFDETSRAEVAARYMGSRSTVVTCDGAVLSAAYPRVVAAADCPVVDTSCAALYCLSAEVQRQGFKVVLTGEGSDEALAGYAWFKVHKWQRLLDCGSVQPSAWLGKCIRRLAPRGFSAAHQREIQVHTAGDQAQTALYHLVSTSRGRFYSAAMLERLAGHVPHEDLELNVARMRRWHPLNQSLYYGYKTMLPGLLLNHKGDRVAMAHSVETRYPFLDDDVVALCARVHPRFKLRRLHRDKHLLRQASVGRLPDEVVRRPKAMFRAPLAETFFAAAPSYVGQLLSTESLSKTSYFDVAQVRQHYADYQRRGSRWGPYTFVEMGLVTVVSTQLWHHLYLGGGLCELPTWSPPSPVPPPA